MADTVAAADVHVLRGPGLSGAVPVAMDLGADSPGVVASLDLDEGISVRRLDAAVRPEGTGDDCAPQSADRNVRVRLGTGRFAEEFTLSLGQDGLPSAGAWQIPAGTFRTWPPARSGPSLPACERESGTDGRRSRGFQRLLSGKNSARFSAGPVSHGGTFTCFGELR